MLSFYLDRFPVPVDRSEYDDVSTVIEERLKSLPGSVALYALGGVSAPGISDVDRIVVVDPSVGPVSFGWESLSPRQRYIAMHTPFLVDVESFRVHEWFAYLAPLTILWGEPQTTDSPPADAAIPARLGIEHLVMARVSLEKVFFTRRIMVRPLLCELNNLHHDLRLAGITQVVAPTAWAVVQEVDVLRSSWWDMEEADQVDRLHRLPRLAIRGIDEALVASTLPAPGTDDTRSICLHGYWSNVVLCSNSESDTFPRGWSPTRLVARRSRRGSELRWRCAKHRLRLPDHVLAFLEEQSVEEPSVLATRRKHFARYSDFMSSGSGWSRIGVVGSLYG